MIFIFYLLFFLIYLIYETRFILHLKPFDNESERQNTPVTIIVSARNEEKNLNNLFQALQKQDYDLSSMELIIVDDHSTDRTPEIIEQWRSHFPSFKTFIPTGRDNVRSPKKNALKQAISNATHDIILMTDADCIPEQGWVNGMIQEYHKYPETDMLIGFSETIVHPDNQSFIRRFEHFDFHTLMFATQATLNMKKVFSGSGQNLSFRKSSYFISGGYDRIMQYLSGDDLHLMQLFKQKKLNVRFASNRQAIMKTQPIDHIKSFFNQRSRWASNMKIMLKSNPEFFLYLISVFFVLTLLPVLLFWNLNFGLIILSIKFSFDLLFIIRGYGCFNLKKKDLPFFPVWFLIQPFYTLTVSLTGFFSIFKWKDRKGFK